MAPLPSRNTWVAGTLSQEPSCGTAGLQVGSFLPPSWHAQSVVAWREFTGVKPACLGQWDINSSLVGSGRSRPGMDAEVGQLRCTFQLHNHICLLVGMHII